MNEKELIELMRSVKEKAPNEFFETIGIMKGIKIMIEKRQKNISNNDDFLINKNG